MPFEKGNQLAGSRKGVPNKTTAEIRNAFQMLVEDNLDNMKVWLSDVAAEDPERALEIILKMSEYIVPKLSRTEVKADITDKSIVINLNRLNAKDN
jgi:hypothetical protein|tara:strand:+ start:1671 stop:1958 length:288 start_codon:yes stop_codon:yes gene_type:complete